MTTGITTRTALALATAAAIGSWGLAASAAGTGTSDSLQKEVHAAEQHATFASEAKSLNEAHTHLHHVINCLVGPKGSGFDSKAMNPCKDLGNGIIPDTTEASEKKSFEAALKKAKSGLSSKELKTAKADGAEIATMLKKDTM